MANNTCTHTHTCALLTAQRLSLGRASIALVEFTVGTSLLSNFPNQTFRVSDNDISTDGRTHGRTNRHAEGKIDWQSRSLHLVNQIKNVLYRPKKQQMFKILLVLWLTKWAKCLILSQQSPFLHFALPEQLVKLCAVYQSVGWCCC